MYYRAHGKTETRQARLQGVWQAVPPGQSHPEILLRYLQEPSGAKQIAESAAESGESMNNKEKALASLCIGWMLAFGITLLLGISAVYRADYWRHEYEKLKAAQPSGGGSGINTCANMLYGSKYGFRFDVFWSQRPQSVVYVGDDSITDAQCLVRVEHLTRGKDGKWTLPPADHK